MPIEQTINTVIAEARTYAASLSADAADLLEKAVRVADNTRSIPSHVVNFTSGTGTLAAPPVPTPFAPPGSGITSKPALPTFQQLTVPQTPALPQAPAALNAAGLFAFQAPTLDGTDSVGDAPSINTTFTMPQAPALTPVDVPQKTANTLGPAPAITLPAFGAPILKPGIDGSAHDLDAQLEELYTEINTRLVEDLDTRRVDYLKELNAEYETQAERLTEIFKQALAEDSEGVINTKLETAIYNRAFERIESERTNAIGTLERSVVGRGFPIPPGLLLNIRAEASREAMQAAARAAAEVAVERSKLERKYADTMLEMQVRLHTEARKEADAYGDKLLTINSRALDHSKEFLNLVVQNYNLAVSDFDASLRHSDAVIKLYEAESKAAMADMELFRLDIESAKLTAEIDESSLRIYEAQLKGESQKIQHYIAQIEAVTSSAKIESTKVELYGEQVRAFATKVGAKEAEFRAYAAAVQGDEGKVRGYSAQVEAYKASVAAVTAVSEVESTAAKIGATYNQNLVEQFRAEVALHGADIAAEQASTTAGLNAYRAALEAYKAELAYNNSQLTADIKREELDLTASVKNNDAKLATTLAEAAQHVSSVELTANVSMEAAKVLQAAASAAVSAQNSMVQLYAQEA